MLHRQDPAPTPASNKLKQQLADLQTLKKNKCACYIKNICICEQNLVVQDCKLKNLKGFFNEIHAWITGTTSNEKD